MVCGSFHFKSTPHHFLTFFFHPPALFFRHPQAFYFLSSSPGILFFIVIPGHFIFYRHPRAFYFFSSSPGILFFLVIPGLRFLLSSPGSVFYCHPRALTRGSKLNKFPSLSLPDLPLQSKSTIWLLLVIAGLDPAIQIKI